MALIHDIEIGRLQRSRIRQAPEILQPFNLRDGSIDVHSNSWMHHPGGGTMVRAPSVIEEV